MDKPGKKLFRCAIYTRKSTDHNLELEFNSLDAQREACEAYIKSQAHEGWRLVPDHYDDGAFSGASLDRPALQELLTEIGAGKIDIIVVYKVDRLTRSLADFAKLVELFDQHSVSFVSVTQSFNTTSSMGRLTLNVLLSFAQFEREVIGERVRDKIAASKRKGIWVGGSVPLGYKSVEKKLVIIPEEAETVRLIFRRYLELGSIRDLVQDLDRKGMRTRHSILSTGKPRGGIRFGVGGLSQLLRNRFYIGEVAYKGAVHPGEQEPILDRTLFEAVQAKLASGASERQLKLRTSPSPLTGIIYDDRGNRMTPSHSNKHGARYRYYISHPVLQKRYDEAGSVARINAPELEALVTDALRTRRHVQRAELESGKNDRDLICQRVERVIVRAQSIDIHLFDAEGQETGQHSQKLVASDVSVPHEIVSVPWNKSSVVSAKGVLHPPTAIPAMNADERDALLTAIAKARAWIDDLVEGRAASFAAIAKHEGKLEQRIRLLAPLAFISPRSIVTIMEGSARSIPIRDLVECLSKPWTDQDTHLRHS